MSGMTFRTSRIDSVAKRRAMSLHRHQTYGGRPYFSHLNDVVAVLQEYGFEDEELLAAAWLHDSAEDTAFTLEECRHLFNDAITDYVDAVTRRPDWSRDDALAHLQTFTEPAWALKVADRIANVRACWRDRDPRLFMYRQRHKKFCRALRQPGNLDPMWAELDTLLGEPT